MINEMLQDIILFKKVKETNLYIILIMANIKKLTNINTKELLLPETLKQLACLFAWLSTEDHFFHSEKYTPYI